ncbi:hypothetical protein N9043_01850 [bacterium]|nr:hypothetical protein [bacterium]
MERANKFKPSVEQIEHQMKSGSAWDNIKPAPRYTTSKGSFSEVIILDHNYNPEEPNRNVHYVSEHVSAETNIPARDRNENILPFNQTKDLYQACSAVIGENCPLCDGRAIKTHNLKSVKKAALNFYLSVIHYKPKDKHGNRIKNKNGEEFLGLKKLLLLNSNEGSNKDAIFDVLNEAFYEINPATNEPYRSVYGVKILLKRGTDQYAPIVGVPVRYPVPKGKQGLGDRYRRISKANLLEAFKKPEVKDDNGNVKLAEDAYIQPYFYDYHHEYRSEKGICKDLGISYKEPIGVDDNNDWGDDGDIPFPEYEDSDQFSNDGLSPFDSNDGLSSIPQEDTPEPKPVENKKEVSNGFDDFDDFDDLD